MRSSLVVWYFLLKVNEFGSGVALKEYRSKVQKVARMVIVLLPALFWWRTKVWIFIACARSAVLCAAVRIISTSMWIPFNTLAYTKGCLY